MGTLAQALMPNVLDRLERGPATLKELSGSIGHNYYTVRMSVQHLMADGLVTSTGLYARNAKYMLTDQAANNNSIPMIANDNSTIKMFELLKLRHATEMAASTAVFNIPMHIARIFMAARRLNEGMAQGDTLARIKNGMQNDLAALQKAVKIYEAVLNNPKNWTESMLMRYPEDNVYSEVEVVEAFNKYFKE